MPPPTLFKPQRELVNYDYFDIAEGVGYVIYFGLRGDDGEYIVSTTSSIFSEEVCTFIAAQSIGTTTAKLFDLDFDIKFNRPRNIKGVAIANIPIGLSAIDTANKDLEFFAICKAVHYDGSTETVLATGTSVTVNEGAVRTDNVSFSSMIAACRMDITTQRHFKKGETLRFIVEGWYKTNEGSAVNTAIMICHDPKNRQFKIGTIPGTPTAVLEFANEKNGGGTVNYQNTQMIFHVPFVIDI